LTKLVLGNYATAQYQGNGRYNQSESLLHKKSMQDPMPATN
jgi:hypothetical protein